MSLYGFDEVLRGVGMRMVASLSKDEEDHEERNAVKREEAVFMKDENGCSGVNLNLTYANYVYHQDGLFDILQGNNGVVEDYDDWAGSEEHWKNLCDDDYNSFNWLAEEGEEVSEGQPLATIRTKLEDYADDYWVILVASCDGILHRKIKNGKHAMDSGELAATIYESMEDYGLAVLATGKVKEKDSRVKKCPNCGTLLERKKKFCGECGAKLTVEEKVCVSCGAKLNPGQKFCCECGTKAE